MDKSKVTNQKFTRLKELLMELFQLDQPELDFGLYRVMHARAKEVTEFLEKDLLPQVATIFEQYRSSDTVSIQEELKEAINQAKELGADPDTLPKVKELKAKLDTGAVDVARLESEVYDHLYTFFRRYYHEGDFLSRRVYKDGVYAIPYSGEEVKLYWANADQYYIKTDEYLKNFTFRLNPENDKDPKRVHFRLKTASEGEHGNIKEDDKKKRRFILLETGFVDQVDGEGGKELVLYFEFKIDPNGKKQEAHDKSASEKIFGLQDQKFKSWIKLLSAKAPTNSNPNRTVLEKHLDRYTKRNTFDYFIHKDLGGFLRREIDFYIKNEVMHLDDVENETAPKVEQYLSKIKAIRKVASKIIDFLAQLEDFQKKLWLKKKFVVETNYCITLDRIPEEFYPEIAANEEQRKEWVKLFAIDDIKGDLVTPGYSEPLSIEFLRNNKSLVLDTKLFNQEFKSRILNNGQGLDGMCNGLLIQSDNFHGLNILINRYENSLSAVYIDPPYNTKSSEIVYKNDYKHSSWLALIVNRLEIGKRLLAKDGILTVAIDDLELPHLWESLYGLFGEENHLGTIAIRINPKGRMTARKVSLVHEYTVLFGKTAEAYVKKLPVEPEEKSHNYIKDDQGNWYLPINLRKQGVDSEAERVDGSMQDRYFPIYFDPKQNRISLVDKLEVEILPIDSSGQKRIWRRGKDDVLSMFETGDLWIKEVKDSYQVYFKFRGGLDGKMVQSMWVDPRFSASDHGTRILDGMLGKREQFSYPKSPFAVMDNILTMSDSDKVMVLDFFAGSGTTAHAVIELNRLDHGNRSFCLIEMGDYFDTVLKPRVVKSIYCNEWKDGKPLNRNVHCSAFVKYLRLESYEDALNNLESKRPAQAQLALDSKQTHGIDGFKEQYILKYMLDVETKGSQSLLNIQDFKDPTAYKMLIKRPGTDESKLVNVDLIETFNWLLGLTVDHIAAPQTFTAAFKRDEEKRLVLGNQLKQADGGNWWFRTVTGKDSEGRSVLVIWRKRPGCDEPEGIEQDNLVLNEWFRKLGFSTKDREFDLIYVNGSNNLENVRTADEKWKVRLIEEDFMHFMFDVEDI